ncbi:Permease [Candidatus Filomicrobium marinum]|uniref:Probable membrane transporter protein n=1 Tax=Candidatus Filomicrobium marinum TaxID=1608628 RepID=A0A0D6JFE3_9HYPH|nr:MULTISPECIES: sulfite exporter TauE/SafE family protein [Filomicrobium]MCV0367822.1 sulfite exporter TauE/SafE family protein [Filomicrobium sp.]CFX20208.1 Permease [Candidatus Filomicrobium marinum]CPR18622.1 Permease [Candidatus Filomicrobium marinum]
MDLYLPIAELSVNVFVFLAMGAAVGFLSGMFGVGGGFLITPLLIFSGIPSAVAVGTGAAQTVASSVSGAIAQYRRNNVDVKMGFLLLMGGIVGAVIGVQVVKLLRQIGQFDLFISLAYVFFLGSIGTLMMIESLNAVRRSFSANQATTAIRRSHHNWIHGLPLKMRFHRSRLYISAIPPVMIGAFVGLLGAIMGVGGGFIMVPAMIYLLRMRTGLVIGTSLFQILFVTAATTVLQTTQNYNVDIVLALILMVGGVIGAQFGAVAGEKLKGEQLRFLLAGLVILVCLRMGWDLVVMPTELFSISGITGGSH